MDVFEFRDRLIEHYERFSRSFTQIRADDVRDAVEVAYRGGRFWPAPLIQINPNFVPGGTIDELVGAGLLEAECAKVYLRLSKDTVYRLAQGRKIPASKAGNQWRFRRREVDTWLDENKKVAGRKEAGSGNRR